MSDGVAKVVVAEGQAAPLEAGWPEHWPSWVKEIADELDEAEKPSCKWIPSGSRHWVLNVMEQAFRSMWPKLIREFEDDGAFTLGQFIGYELEAIHMLPPLVEEGIKKLEELDARMKKKLHPKTYSRWKKHGEKYEKDVERFCEDFGGVLIRKGELIDKVMGGICDKPLSESAEFFRGVSEALQNRVFSESGQIQVGGSRLRLYVLLSMFWRLAETFKTSTQLHRWCSLVLPAETFHKRVATDGGHFLVGEYRGSAVSVVEYLDKESGKKESYVKVVHSVEVRGPSGLETVHLQEMIDRSITTAEQYKNQCWLVPGMRIVVVPRRVEIDKGIKKFTCTTGEMQLLRGNAQSEGAGKK